MSLPFTRDQFLDVFGRFNEALWPFVIALWLASLAAVVFYFRDPQRHSRFINVVLVTQWIWSAIAYHAVFFATINPAAWLFGGLFLIQALLLIFHGVMGKRLTYPNGRGLNQVFAGALMIYALSYPAINWLEGYSYPRMPTFAIPCPTTILTIGFLLAANRPLPKAVAVIPVVWAFIGGSAAFLLGVHADLMLLAAGIVMLLNLTWTREGRKRAKA